MSSSQVYCFRGDFKVAVEEEGLLRDVAMGANFGVVAEDAFGVVAGDGLGSTAGAGFGASDDDGLFADAERAVVVSVGLGDIPVRGFVAVEVEGLIDGELELIDEEEDVCIAAAETTGVPRALVGFGVVDSWRDEADEMEELEPVRERIWGLGDRERGVPDAGTGDGFAIWADFFATDDVDTALPTESERLRRPSISCSVVLSLRDTGLRVVD